MAIVLVVIMMVGFWLRETFTGNLYEKYAATQMPAPAGGNTHADSVLLDATTAFNNKDFTVAAVDLAEVLQLQPGNAQALLYLGISLMQTDQLPKARAVFEKIVRTDPALRYEATWYEALSYVKEENWDTAKDWLEKIPADAPHYAQAQALMKKL